MFGAGYAAVQRALVIAADVKDRARRHGRGSAARQPQQHRQRIAVDVAQICLPRLHTGISMG